jgi:hypothetical protein
MPSFRRTPEASIAAEGDERIDFRRAAGGNPAGSERGDDHDGTCCGEGKRIARRHVKEQASEEAGERQGARQPHRGTRDGDGQAVA